MTENEVLTKIPVSTVLVVDDNDEFRETLAGFVRRQEGFRVVGEAANGTDAIMMTHLLHPDLVLLDINMPQIGGVEAAFKIKIDSPETKVVFVTIHDDPTYRSIAETAQVYGYVSKKSIKKELSVVLRRIREDNARAVGSQN